MSTSSQQTIPDSNRHMLRHSLAALAYRGGKAIRGAPESFAQFHANDTCRTPGQLLGHLGDLMDWSLSQAEGKPEWREAPLLPWEQEKKRFFASLKAFDDYLASDAPIQFSAEKLLQGPIADAFTHVGQIALLRRLAGVPIRAENMVVAEIVIGRVGEDQAPPRREF